jgi:hypothetical protein
MYNIDGIDNIFDLVFYTVKAMSETNHTAYDIENYLTKVAGSDNYNIIKQANYMLNDCNTSIVNKAYDHENYLIDNCDYKDCTLRERYWDDDGRYLCLDNIEDNIIEDDEAYEGFSSCNNNHWDNYYK